MNVLGNQISLINGGSGLMVLLEKMDNLWAIRLGGGGGGGALFKTSAVHSSALVNF